MIQAVFYTAYFAILCCVLISYPLWLNDRFYPGVPVIEEIVFSGFAQWGFLFFWGLSFSSILIPKLDRRIGLIGFFIGAIFLALQDQIRWQPWFYQYGLMFLFYWLYINKSIKKETLVFVFKISVVGIYFWSGIHKINAGFVDIILPGLLGFDILWLGYIAAFGEALMAVLLLFEKTRKLSVLFFFVMHILIMFRVLSGAILYDFVIMPWNISMMFFLYVLFWMKNGVRFTLKRNPLTKAVAILLFMLLPSLNFFGVWHDFQSFTLFSGKEKRAYLFVSDELIENFSEESISKIDQNNRIMLQSLSYPEIRVPTNSEINIYKSIFKTFCERSENNMDIILEIRQMTNLFESEREVTTYFCDDFE